MKRSKSTEYELYGHEQFMEMLIRHKLQHNPHLMAVNYSVVSSKRNKLADLLSIRLQYGPWMKRTAKAQ